jgi:hypothetical protein
VVTDSVRVMPCKLDTDGRQKFDVERRKKPTASAKGLDTEWADASGSVALLQLSTLSRCVLLRLQQLPEFPDGVRRLLAAERPLRRAQPAAAAPPRRRAAAPPRRGARFSLATAASARARAAWARCPVGVLAGAREFLGVSPPAP